MVRRRCPATRFAAAAQTVRKRLAEEHPADGEPYADWWAAVKAEPGLRALVAEHERIFPGDRLPRGQQLTAVFHQAALRQAGFAEAAVLWRYLDNTIVGGIR